MVNRNKRDRYAAPLFVRAVTAVLCAALLVPLLSALFPLSVSAAAYVPKLTEEEVKIRQQVYDYLTEEIGFNPASAYGAMANIEAESTFRPEALGDRGTSYGICQWHNERRDALNAFCETEGEDPATLEAQLHFLKYELETTYPGIFGMLRWIENSEEGAYLAGYSFCIFFEMPRDKYTAGRIRAEAAVEAYRKKFGTKTVCACGQEYDGEYICVCEGEADIRGGHGERFSRLGKIPDGAAVTVTACDGTWAHVEYDHVIGFFPFELLKKADDTPPPDDETKSLLNAEKKIAAHERTVAEVDFDGDSIFAPGDAVALLRLILLGDTNGGTPGGKEARPGFDTDFNGDGVSDTRDAVELLRYALLGNLIRPDGAEESSGKTQD